MTSAYEQNRLNLNNSRNIDPNRFKDQMDTVKKIVNPEDPTFISELFLDLKTGYTTFKSAPGGLYIKGGSALGAIGLRRLIKKADIPQKVYTNLNNLNKLGLDKVKKVPNQTVDIAGLIDEPEKIFKGNTLNKIKRKYQPFPIDKKLPFAEQKRIYKKQLATYINEQWSAGNQIHLPEAYKKFGQLIDPQTNQVVHLKYKTTDPTTGWRSYEPKPQKTTAKEVALRKSREKPWKTEKKQITTILKSVNKEEKLDELLTLIKSEYQAKEKLIKESGLTKGHRKSLAKGGIDVPENIIGEQGKTVGKVKGNFARQHKNDPLDELLSKEGGFVGTLEEYVLMRLKELE